MWARWTVEDAQRHVQMPGDLAPKNGGRMTPIILRAPINAHEATTPVGSQGPKVLGGAAGLQYLQAY
jgi:hypothetical protein